jgi:hypothetical protein
MGPTAYPATGTLENKFGLVVGVNLDVSVASPVYAALTAAVVAWACAAAAANPWAKAAFTAASVTAVVGAAVTGVGAGAGTGAGAGAGVGLPFGFSEMPIIHSLRFRLAAASSGVSTSSAFTVAGDPVLSFTGVNVAGGLLSDDVFFGELFAASSCLRRSSISCSRRSRSCRSCSSCKCSA